MKRPEELMNEHQLRPVKACHVCGAAYTVEQWRKLTSCASVWPLNNRLCVCGAELRLDLQAIESIDSALPVDREKCLQIATEMALPVSREKFLELTDELSKPQPSLAQHPGLSEEQRAEFRATGDTFLPNQVTEQRRDKFDAQKNLELENEALRRDLEDALGTIERMGGALEEWRQRFAVRHGAWRRG